MDVVLRDLLRGVVLQWGPGGDGERCDVRWGRGAVRPEMAGGCCEEYSLCTGSIATRGTPSGEGSTVPTTSGRESEPRVDQFRPTTDSKTLSLRVPAVQVG